MLAISIERWNLHKRIALTIIYIIGTQVKSIILGFMIATAFMSMWISNTATAIMMLPIGMAIISQLKDDPRTIENENTILGKALMLSIAYSASIGGLATLIGTPPNLVFAGVVHELYGYEISFVQWFKIGLPVSVILLFICWKYLVNIAFSFKQTAFPGGKNEIRSQLKKMGKISFEERSVLILFAATALAWITRPYLINPIFPSVDDTIIALTAGLLLFILPVKGKTKRALINWEEAVKLPWGVLLLFGGGLAIAQAFRDSGLAAWIGSQMSLLEGVSLIVLLLAIIAMVNFLTEITSNLATTAMLLPVLAPLALSIDVHPFLLMAGATIAASCAFMLPVATPPNAIVFGSGYLKIPDMVRTGIWMNILSIVLLSIFIYFLLPFLWNFNASVFPNELPTQ